jgi:hypothetical protein
VGSLAEDARLADSAAGLAAVEQVAAERRGGLATLERELARLEDEIDMVAGKAGRAEERAVAGWATWGDHGRAGGGHHGPRRRLGRGRSVAGGRAGGGGGRGSSWGWGGAAGLYEQIRWRQGMGGGLGWC